MTAPSFTHRSLWRTLLPSPFPYRPDTALIDTLLRDVSEFLRRKLRETDYVFRWGGDEFLVLMSCPAPDAARRMATLEAEYETAPLITALGGGVGLTVGCAEAPPGTKDIEPVIAAADAEIVLGVMASLGGRKMFVGTSRLFEDGHSLPPHQDILARETSDEVEVGDPSPKSITREASEPSESFDPRASNWTGTTSSPSARLRACS